MPIVDRMEFPRRYKLKVSVLILIIFGAIFGIWLQRHSAGKLAEQIVISNVTFGRFGTQFIELEYTLANTGKQDREISLMAKVWDAEGQELASALFGVNIPAGSKAKRSKLLDRLNRTLREGEKPYKAEISLYTRRVP